jgi:hypothetical protein
MRWVLEMVQNFLGGLSISYPQLALKNQRTKLSDIYL